MKKLILLFLFSLLANAQIKGVVKDSITKEPIAYVTLVYENSEIGTNANEKGEFELQENQNNSKIIVTCLGYKLKKIFVSEANEILLSLKEQEIKEVLIENSKNKEEVIIGDYQGIEFKTALSNIGQKKYHIWAKYIKYNNKCKEFPFIKTIQFPTKSKLKNVLLRIRFFSVDINGNPLADLNSEEIIVNIKKGKNDNVVDVSNHLIKIDEKGIVIGLENLLLDQNKYEYNYTELGNKNPKKGFSYEPSILAFYGNVGSTILLNSEGKIMNMPGSYNSIEIPIKITLTN